MYKRLDQVGVLPAILCRSTKTTSLYALLDPRDRTVRYIGVSVSPVSRLRWHLEKPARCLSLWLLELKREGLEPELRVLGRTCVDTWQDTERSWISFFRGHAELLNEHEGGKWSGGKKKSSGGKPRFSGERQKQKKKKAKKQWHAGRSRSGPPKKSLAQVWAARPLKPPSPIRFEE